MGSFAVALSLDFREKWRQRFPARHGDCTSARVQGRGVLAHLTHEGIPSLDGRGSSDIDHGVHFHEFAGIGPGTRGNAALLELKDLHTPEGGRGSMDVEMAQWHRFR